MARPKAMTPEEKKIALKNLKIMLKDATSDKKASAKRLAKLEKEVTELEAKIAKLAA